MCTCVKAARVCNQRRETSTPTSTTTLNSMTCTRCTRKTCIEFACTCVNCTIETHKDKQQNCTLTVLKTQTNTTKPQSQSRCLKAHVRLRTTHKHLIQVPDCVDLVTGTPAVCDSRHMNYERQAYINKPLHYARCLCASTTLHTECKRPRIHAKSTL